MSNKAVFLDRDGTINVEKNYLYKIADFEFTEGAVNALEQLNQAGYLLIIVTNQSGIGRGYYTEKDFDILNNWMLEFLKEHGVEIKKVYYCPHLPDAVIKEYQMECNCRKPKTEMFYQAAREFDIDFSKSFAIGDKMRDLSICKETACKGILLDNKEQKTVDNVNNCFKWQSNIIKAYNLEEAAKKILYKDR